MDKNSITGLIIIALMIIGYSIYTRPSQEELEKQKIEQQRIADSLARAQEKPQEEVAKENPAKEEIPVITGMDTLREEGISSEDEAAYGDLGPAITGVETDIIVENEKYSAVISSKGGRLKQVTLKGYQTYDSLPLVLFDEMRSKQDFVFVYPGFGKVRFSDLYFTPDKTHIELNGEGEESLVLTAMGRKPGQMLKIIYTLKGNTYDLFFKVQSTGFNGFGNFDDEPLSVNWVLNAPQMEKPANWKKGLYTFFYKYKNDDRDWLSETKEDELVLEQPTTWVAFKEGYFSTVVFSGPGFIPGKSAIKIMPHPEDETKYVKAYIADLAIPSTGNGQVEMNYFFGPNKLEALNPYNDDLPRIINYGWSFIGWINRHVIHHVFDWFLGLGMSVGIAILMLTIIIKLILSPLMLKNYVSSAKMRVLKPEVDEINKKFEGKDATQKQQAIMALYRETGVNPLSGCLPMLIQMPILYAMFRFFPSNIALRQASFLWADDLSSYDSILELGFNIPMYGDHISLFTLLMAATTLIYTWMSSGNMPESSQPGMPNMKVMMYIFPVMMIFFFNSYSSGLTYYYFVSTLISILQMWVIKEYFIDEEKIHAKLQANKAKPKKKSKFQMRLEEVARQQQQQAKKKKKK